MPSSLIDTYSLSPMKTSSTFLSNVRTVVKYYVWPLLAAFGLTGNCISILILTRRRLIRTSTNNYLTILAAFDSCYLVSTLLLNIASHPKFSTYLFSQVVSYFLRPLADFSSNTATWLIVGFTIERTLAIAKPIYAKRTCSMQRSRHLTCAILTWCFLITLPAVFERNLVQENYFDEVNSNFTILHNTSKQRELFFRLHRLYLIFICITIIWIPLLLVCICNSILIWFLHRSQLFDDHQGNNGAISSHRTSVLMDKLEYFKSNSPKSSVVSSSLRPPNRFYLRRHSRSIVQKRRVTIVLIFSLFVALLLWTPQSLSLTYEILVESYSDMSYEHRIILLVFNDFANLFLCINASIDFILYCFLSEKFARTCRQTIFRQWFNSNVTSARRTRLLSFDTTSVTENTSNTLCQQQSAAHRTKKHHASLYKFHWNSPSLDSNQSKNWIDKKHPPSTSSTQSEKHLYCQNSSLDHLQKARHAELCNTTVNVRINPIISYIDDDDENIHDMTNGSKYIWSITSPKTFRSETRSIM